MESRIMSATTYRKSASFQPKPPPSRLALNHDHLLKACFRRVAAGEISRESAMALYATFETLLKSTDPVHRGSELVRFFLLGPTAQEDLARLRLARRFPAVQKRATTAQAQRPTEFKTRPTAAALAHRLANGEDDDMDYGF
jgi:hypothetical protein